MTHDILGEGAISLNAAMRMLADESGSCPSPVTGWRWCRRGIERNGRKVKLEYARIGRRIVTSKAAVSRFVSALAQADADITPLPQAVRVAPTSRSASRRKRAVAEAAAVCAAARI